MRAFEHEAVLNVNGVEAVDEGEYSCKIWNSAGLEICKCQLDIEKAKSTTALPVASRKESSSVRSSAGRHLASSSLSSSRPQPPPQPATISRNEQSQKPPKVAKSAPPPPPVSISKHLASQNLVEGEPLVLECIVSDESEPVDMMWLRNGKEIPTNPDFARDTLDNGRRFRLTVNEIYPEDSGVFAAQLTSSSTANQLITSCSVVVRGTCKYI